MFGRRKRRQVALFNKAPKQFYCPACMSKNISLVGGDSWAYSYKCGSCGSVFNVSTGMDPDDFDFEVKYMPGGVDIDWDACPDPLETMRLLAKTRDDPPAMIDDPELIQWVRDYWAYVDFLERGLGLSYSNLFAEGGYMSILDSIRDPEDVIAYITRQDYEENWTPEERELVNRLQRIRRRLVV